MSEQQTTVPPGFQIKTAKLDDLKAFELNPRKHTKDVDALVASIKKYGWTNPILIQKGTNRIVAGHGRALAALKAGLKEVPVIELDLNDRDADAYTIADNKLAENSEWDLPKLKELLVQLDDGDFDLSLTGFDEKELSALIDRAGAAIDDAEAKDTGAIFEQLTFTVTKEQAAMIGFALNKAEGKGAFGETGNANRRSNALVRVCEAYS